MAITNRYAEIEFLNNDHDKISSANIVSETMEITRSICDGNFKLGGCIAAKFQINLIDIPPDKIIGKRIRAWLKTTSETSDVIYPQTNALPRLYVWPGMHTISTVSTPMFTGTIDAAERQADRQIIKITAYDDLYTDGQKNVYTWYSQFAQYSGTGTISGLLESLFNKLSLSYSLGTINRTSTLSLSANLVKSNYASNIQAVEIIKSANELMCCFGYCDGWGRYCVKSLSNTAARTIQGYKDLRFEEYVTSVFDTIVLCYGSGQTYKRGRPTTADSSCYYVDDNVILNCCTDASAVAVIGQNMSEAGKLLYNLPQYRPFELEIEGTDYNLGDWVAIQTDYADVPLCKSYIMSQKITGPLALMSVYSAQGDRILQGDEDL